jgi:hypothetical protein
MEPYTLKIFLRRHVDSETELITFAKIHKKFMPLDNIKILTSLANLASLILVSSNLGQ